MHDDDSLDCGHYVSDFFYQHGNCDDDSITKISDWTEGFYIRESHKNKVSPVSKKYFLWFISEQAIL